MNINDIMSIIRDSSHIINKVQGLDHISRIRRNGPTGIAQAQRFAKKKRAKKKFQDCLRRRAQGLNHASRKKAS